MDLQKFKNKMQTEDALPLNILLDEAQSVHKNGSMEVDAAGEFMQDIEDKLGITKMICKDLRTGEIPVDDNPVKLTFATSFFWNVEASGIKVCSLLSLLLLTARIFVVFQSSQQSEAYLHYLIHQYAYCYIETAGLRLLA